MPMQTEREKQILQINRQAMNLLGDLDNMDKVKALLEENCKANPCPLTLNNYAHYLLEAVYGDGSSIFGRGEKRKLRAGEKLLRRCLEWDGENDRALSQLGNSMLWAGRYRAAAGYLARAVARRDTPQRRYNLGVAQYMAGRYALAAEQFAYLEALLPQRKGLREDREGLCGLFNTVEAPPLHAYYILSLYFSGERERAMRAFNGLKREKKRGTDTLIGCMPELFPVCALAGDCASLEKQICGELRMDGGLYNVIGDLLPDGGRAGLKKKICRRMQREEELYHVKDYAILGLCRAQARHPQQYDKLRALIQEATVRKTGWAAFAARRLRLGRNLPRLCAPQYMGELGIYRECHYYGCPRHDKGEDLDREALLRPM